VATVEGITEIKTGNLISLSEQCKGIYNNNNKTVDKGVIE